MSDWFNPANDGEAQILTIGAKRERDRIIEQIKRNICFDALADHEAMAPFRIEHPEAVGRCAHHGGKCTDLLLLVTKLEAGN
jgi:hypothetical protein